MPEGDIMGQSRAAILGIVLVCGGCATQESGLRGVVSSDAQVELVKEGFVLTEDPLPMQDGGLLFTDVRASRIYRLDVSGNVSVFRDQTNETNGLAYTPRGELVAAETGGKRLSVTSANGEVRELTRGDGTNPLVAVNDLIADRQGGIYFTDPNVRPIVPGRKVYVYYLPPGARQARVVDDSMVRPNGLTLTLDGSTLLVDDTVGHEVFAFDVMPDGSLAGKRPFARLRNIKEGEDSGADGMAIDREGRIYVTTVTGVQMFDRTGEYLGTIPVPRRPTNVAFSGPGKGTLYITAREGLYRIRTLTRGPDRPGK
jgi:gluconolactonase